MVTTAFASRDEVFYIFMTADSTEIVGNVKNCSSIGPGDGVSDSKNLLQLYYIVRTTA